MNKKLKSVFKVTVITLAIVFMALLIAAHYGWNLDFLPYQRVKSGWDSGFASNVIVIENAKQELDAEEQYGVQIKDGVDYGRFSLILSQKREITRFYIDFNDMLTIAGATASGEPILCDYDAAEAVHENEAYVYIVPHKNILSMDQTVYRS